jgi:predicted phage baseplate assembly protein
MPIRPPSLDDRSFDDLVSELLARIPAHTPEWTDPRPGDPGRTVLELFAWLTDTLLYRVNLSPEKQRLAFLQLLGIPLKPALAAQGLICLELTSPSDTQTYRLRPLARLKGPVDFETCDELTVLPLNLQVYVKQKLSVSETARYAEVVQGLSRIYNLTASQQAAPYFTTPIFSGGRPEAGGFSAASRTVDGCFWLALLASSQENQADHNQAVRQALDGASDGRALLLNIGVVPTLALPSDFADFGSRQQVPHVWEISTGRQFRGEPEYLPLTVVQDSSNRLLHQGIVRLALPTSGQIGVPDNDVRSFVQAGVGSHPPRLDFPETATRLVAWIRLRPLPAESLRGVAGSNPTLPDLSLSWLGINAVAVDQRQTIQGRVLLGQSSGQADQEISLPGQSVQAESLAIEVEASGGVFQPWQRIEDLALAGRDAAVYSLDSEAGAIRFGDGLRGRIPEINSRIRVAQMRSGGGRAGNLPPGALTAISAQDGQGLRLSSQFKVLQALPLIGGEDAETLEAAERRIPDLFRHRDRAVTESDYRQLAGETPGVRLGRVELLPRFKPQQRRSPVPGVVSVLVLPQADAFQPPNPRPDRPTLERVHAWLDQRRPLATELYVIGCEYVALGLSVGVEVQNGFGQDGVLQAVKEALQRFLWPLVPGGLQGEGWPLGRSIQERELEVVVSRVPGVEGVTGLRLFLQDQADHRWRELLGTDAQPASLRLEVWQLPELLAVVVANGAPSAVLDPQPLAGDRLGIAVPVMPEVC